MKISGLHCSLEINGVLYLGTQYKQVYAVNSQTHEVITIKETASSVNSLSVGDTVDVLLAGQSGGHISVFKIGDLAQQAFEKVKEVKVTNRNISKIVRTSRNDFALGTESGVLFCAFKPPMTFNIALTQEKECLSGKDVTELSEYAHDQFIVG